MRIAAVPRGGHRARPVSRLETGACPPVWPAASMPPMIATTAVGIVIDVRVITRAGTSGVSGTRAGALLVRLQAPPVDGAANTELVEVITAALGVPKRSVSIVAGPQSRQKRVRAVGIDAATATTRLLAASPPAATSR